jgi:hypothetical protein
MIEPGSAEPGPSTVSLADEEGVKEAVEAGAPERNQSIGIRVDLPFEQEVNPWQRAKNRPAPATT